MNDKLVTLLSNPKDLLRDPQELLSILPYMIQGKQEDRHSIFNGMNDFFLRCGPVTDLLGFPNYWYTSISLPGKVFFSLTFDIVVLEIGYSIYLNHIYSLEREQGHADQCLRTICDLADSNGATIFLHADPEADKPVDVKKLRDWYSKHGFVFDLIDLPGGLNGAMRTSK